MHDSAYLGKVIWEHVNLGVNTKSGQQIEKGEKMKKRLLISFLVLFCIVGCTTKLESDSVQEFCFCEEDEQNIMWDQIQFPVDLKGMGTCDSEQEIKYKQQAQKVAVSILESCQDNGEFLDYVLLSITHFTQDNIWRFEYSIDQRTVQPDDLIDSEGLYVAVDGNTGRLIQAWMEEG